MVDWKAVGSGDRLLSAVVATVEGMKLDYRKIAALYGEGATRDAIENRFRVIKREAAKMKEGSESGDNATAVEPATPKKQASTPKKKKEDAVASGRVTKAKNTKPGRKSPAKVKEENNDEGSASPSDTQSASPTKVKAEDGEDSYRFDKTGMVTNGNDDSEE